MAPRTLVLEAEAPSRTLDALDTLETPSPTDPRRPYAPDRRGARSVATGAIVLLAGLAFGLFGLVAMAPLFRQARRRRAQACGMCRRSQKVWVAVSVAVALLTLAGGAVRVAQDEVAIPKCPVTSMSAGTSFEDVRQPAGGTLPAPLHAALDAPAGGLAMAFGHWQGRTMCDIRHPSLTMSFIPASRTTAGSTIGDVFVTPPRPNLNDDQTTALARHEARHSDQWAVATALGGITLLPTAYVVDQSLYPNELNHFEQAAGLAAGGYPPAPAQPPGPRAWALAGWLLVAGLILRRRLRHIARTVAGRPVRPKPQLCAVHTPGW
ncbi:hypothetical protein ACWEOW_23265 [Monashia sp. NPDC004114]